MQDNQATAFWITGVQVGELRQHTLPTCTDNDVRVRTLYSAISKGTESLVFSARVPPSEYTRMRAPFQDGDFPYPIKYGYSNVGEVVQGPDHVLGQLVFCLYPHQSAYVVPQSAITLLPPDLPASRAILCANMETAINAVWDASPGLGDKVSVIGAGVVGILIAWLLTGIPGCHVQLVDINKKRQATAEHLGLKFCLPDAAEQQQDLVIHCSASESGLATAIDIAGFEATILEVSWYGDNKIAVPLGGAFHSQRLQLQSSQVGHIAIKQRARWNYQRRLALALSLLTDARLDCLINAESQFIDLPDTMATLTTLDEDTLCHRIRYPK